MSIYDAVILATFVGFTSLAFLLLLPVWRFLNREEKASLQWTPEALASRARKAAAGELAPGDDESAAIKN